MKKTGILFLIAIATLSGIGKDRFVRGRIVVRDEKGHLYHPAQMPRPNFCVKLYYHEPASKDPLNCPGEYEVTDDWEFTALIKEVCNSDKFFGKKLYLKPDMTRFDTPIGWTFKQPEKAYICLLRDQYHYTPDPLIIEIPSELSDTQRDQNMKMGMELFKTKPEYSLLFFHEAARGGNQKYAKTAYDYLMGQSRPDLVKMANLDYINIQEKHGGLLDRKPGKDERENSLPVYTEPMASLQGTVQMGEGNILPGMMVTLIHEGNRVKATTTSESGSFKFKDLIPGVYQLIFSLEGFKELKYENIRLDPGATLQYDITIDMEDHQDL